MKTMKTKTRATARDVARLFCDWRDSMVGCLYSGPINEDCLQAVASANGMQVRRQTIREAWRLVR
jgi:hypothetical protein